MVKVTLAPVADAYKQTDNELLSHHKAFTELGCASKPPSCAKNIYVGLFFDGTSNSHFRDFKPKFHSNVARLYFLHPNNRQKGIYSIYMQGVGTAFQEIGEPKDSAMGAAFGAGGTARINYAIISLLNVVSRHLVNEEPLDFLELIKERDVIMTAGRHSNVAEISRLRDRFLLDDLSRSLLREKSAARLVARLLEKIPLAKRKTLGVINLSVFGFSRGAAEARAFLNQFHKIFPGNKMAGFTVNVYFAGLFDTVSSVGTADVLDTKSKIDDGFYDWAKQATVPTSMVKKCCHFIALHEVRACFPLTTLNTFPQTAYPGTHSDVGGGYGHNLTQGKKDISVVPGLHMYFKARAAGVPLIALNKPFNAESKIAALEYTLPATTIKDFNQFLRNMEKLVGSKTAALETMTKVAMDSYFTHRGLIAKRFEKEKFYDASSRVDQGYLKTVNDRMKRRVGETFSLKQPMEIVRVAMLAADKQAVSHFGEHLPKELHLFYADYIHDSVASFIGMGMNEFLFNGVGILRYRKIFPY